MRVSLKVTLQRGVITRTSSQEITGCISVEIPTGFITRIYLRVRVGTEAKLRKTKKTKETEKTRAERASFTRISYGGAVQKHGTMS